MNQLHPTYTDPPSAAVLHIYHSFSASHFYPAHFLCSFAHQVLLCGLCRTLLNTQLLLYLCIFCALDFQLQLEPSCAGFKFPFHYRRNLHSSLSPLASFDDHNEVHHIRISICICDCLCVCIFESVFVPAGERHSLAAGDRGAGVSDLHRLQNCQIRARIFSNI